MVVKYYYSSFEIFVINHKTLTYISYIINLLSLKFLESHNIIRHFI